MSGATINGKPATELSICVHRSGAWSIDLRAQSDAAITGPAVVVFAGITFRGTVVRGAVFAGSTSIRIAPGAGGLSKTARPKHYRATSASVVLEDLLSVSGDALDATADRAALARAITSWTVGTEPVSTCISHLMSRLGLAWRMLPNGSLWAGAEAWPATGVPDAETRVLEQDDANGEVTLGVLSPTLLPGTAWRGRRISYAETTMTGEATRTRLVFETDRERVGGTLGALVRSMIPQLRHLAPVWAKVVAQAGSTIDVTPEDATYPPMAGVPLTVGVPGVKANVSAGARVLVGWSGGDPRYPYVHGWDQSEHANSVAFEAGYVRHGAADASNGVAKGNETKQVLGLILDQCALISNSGGPTANAGAFTALKGQLESIPSTKVFTK